MALALSWMLDCCFPLRVNVKLTDPHESRSLLTCKGAATGFSLLAILVMGAMFSCCASHMLQACAFHKIHCGARMT